MTALPTVRTSERSTFRRCPQRWWWEYRLGLKPKHLRADARWFGIGIHEALARWYHKGTRRGAHPADTFADWVGDEIAWVSAAYADHEREWDDKPKYEDAAELGEEMLVNYIDEYGRDPQWHIIATEQTFKVKVTRQGTAVGYFASTWDGVARDKSDGQVYLLEHKTATQISTAYLELDDQGGSYWAVASAILRAKGILKPGESIAGIWYNFLRKCKKDTRPRNEGGAYLNQDGSVSKKQPPPAFVRELVERSPAEQKSQMERLADEITVMNAMQDGTIPVFKNTTRECTFCDFFVACKLHERGSPAYKEILKADFVKVDPYEDNRKSASTW